LLQARDPFGLSVSVETENLSDADAEEFRSNSVEALQDLTDDQLAIDNDGNVTIAVQAAGQLDKHEGTMLVRRLVASPHDIRIQREAQDTSGVTAHSPGKSPAESEAAGTALYRAEKPEDDPCSLAGPACMTREPSSAVGTGSIVRWNDLRTGGADGALVRTEEGLEEMTAFEALAHELVHADRLASGTHAPAGVDGYGPDYRETRGSGAGSGAGRLVAQVPTEERAELSELEVVGIPHSRRPGGPKETTTNVSVPGRLLSLPVISENVIRSEQNLPRRTHYKGACKAGGGCSQ